MIVLLSAVDYITMGLFPCYNMAMLTSEGKKIDRHCPRGEYPRPQMERKSYFSLNGEWDFCLNKERETPKDYPSKILVPFAMETPLSGIEKVPAKDDFLHYRKRFSLPKEFIGKRVLLHFEAVDQVAEVSLNGKALGRHKGGYLPFEFEIESAQEDNELLVCVQDDITSPIYPRGKQSLDSKGIWYTSTSGIWGCVWLEAIPKEAIRVLKIEPDFDSKKVKITVAVDGDIACSFVIASFQGNVIFEGKLDENGCASIDCSSSFHPWSPEEPNLYDLEIGVNEDKIRSYFGLRKFGTTLLKGKKVFALNNEPYLMKGVLDQGYFPDGGLTAPSDQAMINDIALMKSMGFNMLRKHIKIEPARWYYHCDRLGVLVVQDFVNNGGRYSRLLISLAPFIPFRFKDTRPKDYARFRQKNEASRKFFESQMSGITSLLFNVVSICTYVLFNEGWGQFDSARLTKELRQLDAGRLVDSDCGWYDQGVGDYSGNHIYFRPIRMKHDGKRILSLSEFGGYSLRVPDHCFSAKEFGYKSFKTKEKLERGLTKLFLKELKKTVQNQKVSSYVLTQLSDVEQETNGLVTYDREIVKVDVDLMRELNNKVSW